jgi:hypothetical protein
MHILIGHSKPGQRGTACALYVGDSAAELEAARLADTTAASHTILSNVGGIRKHNSRYIAPSPEPPAAPETETLSTAADAEPETETATAPRSRRR